MRLTALAMAVGVLLTACSTSYRSVTVHVRDGGSREPVADARVEVRPLHLFLPEYPHEMIAPSPHRGGSAVTNTEGAATLDAPARHPFELFVLIPNDPPRGATIDDLGAATPVWIRLSPGATEDATIPTLEVRVE